MSTPIWTPGTFYNPGAIVQRASSSPVLSGAILNPSFEDGDSDWTKDTGWTIGLGTVVNGVTTQFDGSWRAQFNANATDAYLTNDALIPVTAGRKIKAQCMVRQGDSNGGVAGARVLLAWYDTDENLISRALGTLIDAEPKTKYVVSTVTGTAPATAAFVKVGAVAFRNSGSHPLWVDTFTWDYAYQDVNANLVFRAVQANAGYSGAIEPLWPNVNGEQVIDNDVTWEAITASRVVWEAHPILVSGYDEPEWPLDIGGSIADNTIVWTAIPRRVVDEKCPNTAVVIAGASKIFAGDDDIVAFSATVNPLDWTTSEDAGYLPFGLQAFGANPVAALGLYRTNLVAFNSEGFQMWQIDEDPANMAILDAVPIGCIYARTVFPVMNDLVFLSAVGVRNIGIAGASTNLQAGTFGEAIDPLVQAKITADEYEPLGVFVPTYGQYWLFFGDEAFVLTITDVKKQSWSRYTFPEAITDWTIENGTLLVRTATHKVWSFTTDETTDDTVCEDGPDVAPFPPFALDIVNPGAETGTDGTSIGWTAVHGIMGSYDFLTPPPQGLRFWYGSVPIDEDPLSSLMQAIDLADYVAETPNLFEQIDEDHVTFTLTWWGITYSGDGAPYDTTAMLVRFYDEDSVLISTYNSGEQTPTTPLNGPESGWAADEYTDDIPVPAGARSIEVEMRAHKYNEDHVDNSGSFDYIRIDVSGLEPGPEVCTGEDIIGVIQWPHLDFNSIAVEKMFVGLDLVTTAPEGVLVSIGYDQRDLTARTEDYEMVADSLPGQMVPIPCAGPSFDVRLTFNPGQRWEWNATVIYVQDMRPGS